MSEGDAMRLALAAAAGYPFSPRSIETLSGGRINDNYHLRTENLDTVLRFYPPGRAKKQVLFELSLLSHLKNKGCRVPAILRRRDGAELGCLEGRLFTWVEYLNAAPLSPLRAYELDPQELKRLLEPVFLALESFSPPFSGTTETRVFSRRLPSLLSVLREEGQESRADCLQNLFDSLAKWEQGLSLPVSALHADLHPGNILENRAKTGLWLIDFDDGHVGHRAVDWVLPALEFAFAPSGTFFDEERYRSLLSVLVPERATKEELEALPRLRTLMTLKFAVALADLGDPLEENRYLRLLDI